MTNIARIYLIAVAVICGGPIAIIGLLFSSAVNEEPLGYLGIIFLLFFVAVIVLPLLIPAVIPSRWEKAFLFSKRVGAACLIIPICLFLSILIRDISYLLKGWDVSILSLSFGIVAVLSCIGAFFVLLWPEINRVQRALITRR